VPASEIATWTRIGASSASPDPTFLQSAAFDETRKVVMMFGGFNQPDTAMPLQASPDLWEWDPATGLWTNRRPTPPGDKPYRRAGAGMVFDSIRNKLVIFGGRTTAISNYADIFDWDPTTGLFTDRTNLTGGPQARSQHGMVFEKSTGKVLLFGGGVASGDSLDSADQTLVSVALGDTWEWDPATGKWTQLQPASTPSARYDSALVWDSKRSRAVLFGGMEKPQAGLNGVPKQDTWEWDPATHAWTNRTTTGQKPSPRYGHCMAFDPNRGVTVLVGGWDIDTGDDLADVWEWEPISGAWTQRLTGSEPNLPPARMFASLVTDSVRNRLELVGGQLSSYTTPPTMEIWELEPTTAVFTDRSLSSPKGWPPPRSGHAMAFCPATGKTYVFGGQDNNGVSLDDLWEWDGTTWSEVAGDVRPSGRMNAAMAYDPFRKSLILFGGSITLPPSNIPTNTGSEFFRDTWEWNSATRKWTQLLPASSPEPRDSHGMVTDSGRAKVLLFGGESYSYASTYPIPGETPSSGGGIDFPYTVWEWDGANTTWSNRTPAPLTSSPNGGLFPPLSFDDGRQKMFLLFDISGVSGDTAPSTFWEWDPVSAGWAQRDMGDLVYDRDAAYMGVAYDSLRRRQILARSPNDGSPIKTWELDTKTPTLFQRVLSSAPKWPYAGSAMTFDSQRGVVVFFGGGSGPTNETWEYKVTNLANGEGCTAAKASTCGSGFCVDGVCCSTASCAGPCQSCAAAGHEGTCTRADPGTEVPGSCADGQACDGTGKCKTKNGLACTSAAACASGFCVDGVCCESACDDFCVACNQAGRAGKCSPYAAGSDPEHECGQGSDPCRSFCTGAAACDSAPFGTPCGPCALCDGNGTCAPPDPASCGPSDAGAGGSGGNGGTGGGGAGGSGGFGGSVIGGQGGAGGLSIGGRGGAGGASGFGGFGGGVTGGAGTSGGSATGGSGNFGGTNTGGSGGFGGTTTMGGAGGAAASGGAGGAGGLLDGGVSGLGGTTAASNSPDGGQYPIPPDAGNPDGTTTSISPDAGNSADLHRSGCNCDLGQSRSRAPGLPFVLLGATLLWRRRRRRQMRAPLPNPLPAFARGNRIVPGRRNSWIPRLGQTVLLLLLTTCSQNDPGRVASLESSHRALGTVPATESATWTRFGAPTSPTPNPRYMQSAAFDETRKVLVMFGGRSGATDGNEYGAATQDLWEWDPATGKWTDRTPTGNKPSKRAGASMVFDSSRNKFIIFGGRSTTGYDYEDIWEWDPVDGSFLDRTDSGTAPGGRSQHSMVFERSTSMVLLFGGGIADSGSSIWPEKFSYSDPGSRPGPGAAYDGTGISLAFADTWEWNPATGGWTKLTPSTAPSARYDSALVWDSKRSRAVLFGGMQKAEADADGVPQRDVWEWDPATPGWTLRTSTGSMPSARWGHSMAYDPGRGTTVVVGGKDLQTHVGLADVWDWNPTTLAWAQRLTGREANLPEGRMYASLVTDSGQDHLDLVAGLTFYGTYDNVNPPDPGNQVAPSAELWELEPISATFTNRSASQNSPGNRWGHAMAFCPATGKTYVFGGANDKNPFLDDLWEWDGNSWSQVQNDVRPPGRSYTGIAYDPSRKSLILYSGESVPPDLAVEPSA